MFPPPLAGMSLTPTSTGAVLGFPRPIGQAWLIQLATGDDPVKLNAIDVSPTVRSVHVDAAPDNFSLALRLANESPQLWGHPDLFLPEVGLQEVDFSPLAQKRLAELLTDADAQSAVTLSVALEFRSMAAVRWRSRRGRSTRAIRLKRSGPMRRCSISAATPHRWI